VHHPVFSYSTQGFVNNMAEYMACCDCVITKAGPGTIAEALTCGLPIVLNGRIPYYSSFTVHHKQIVVFLGCIPCQEEGNIPYVLQNGVGTYSEHPMEIAQIISEWFGPQKHKLQKMSILARGLGRPEATFDIVRSLAGESEFSMTSNIIHIYQIWHEQCIKCPVHFIIRILLLMTQVPEQIF